MLYVVVQSQCNVTIGRLMQRTSLFNLIHHSGSSFCTLGRHDGMKS